MAATVERWLEALESGNYHQIQGLLAGDGGFCCLGVAYDVGGAGWREDWSTQRHSTCLLSSHDGWDLGELGAYLLQGLEGGDGMTMEREVVLAEMNDAGWDFAEIAAYVRADLYLAH